MANWGRPSLTDNDDILDILGRFDLDISNVSLGEVEDRLDTGRTVDEGGKFQLGIISNFFDLFYEDSVIT